MALFPVGYMAALSRVTLASAGLSCMNFLLAVVMLRSVNLFTLNEYE